MALRGVSNSRWDAWGKPGTRFFSITIPSEHQPHLDIYLSFRDVPGDEGDNSDVMFSLFGGWSDTSLE